jgi:hypothetical protein
LHELGGIDAKPSGELQEVMQIEVALTALYLTEKGPVDPDLSCHRLLRETENVATVTDPFAKDLRSRGEWTGHVGIALITAVCNAAVSAAQAAEPLTWSAPQLIDHQRPFGNPPALEAVSCPTTSFCAAVSGGSALTTSNPTGGESAWTSTTVEEGNELRHISCPSEALCVASDSTGGVLTSSDPTGGSEAWSVASVSEIGNPISSISCPSTSLCVAVAAGEILTSTDPTGGASAWKDTTISTSGSTFSVSCPTTKLCVIAGAVEGKLSVITSTDPTGGAGAWTPATISGFIGSLSCPSESLCVIASGSDITSSTDPTGGSGAWTTVSSPDHKLDSVNCPSTALCVATDYAGNVVTSTNPTGGEGAWTVANVDETNIVDGVWCPSTALCVAVDSYGRTITSTDPTGGSSAWTAHTIDPGTTNSFTGISCSSASLCAAVDNSSNIVTSTSPASKPSLWTVTSIGSGEANRFSAISCPSTSLCVATDYSDLGEDETAYVLTSTDPTGGIGAWTRTTFHEFNGLGGAKALSCPTTKLCVSANFFNGITTSTNPTGGSSAWTTTNIGGTDGLFGVSCASTSLRVVVDGSGDVLTSTDPTGGSGAWTLAHVDGTAHLDGISCPTTSLCVAVDQSGNLVTSTNPTGGVGAWTVTHLPTVFELTSVSCSSVTFCVGVGFGVDASFGVGGVAVTATDPTGGEAAWSLDNAIDDAIGTESQLSGVSCVAEAFCLAVDQLGNAVLGTPASEEHTPPAEERHETTGGGTSSTSSSTTSTSSGSSTTGSTPPIATISSAQLGAALGQQLIPPGKVATISTLLKDHGLVLSFKALEAGTLLIQWYELPPARLAGHKSKPKPILVGSGQTTFAAAGSQKLTLKLTAAGKALLKHTKSVKLMARGMFTPRDASAVTTQAAFVVRR